jgi:hypothetical protein
MGYRSQVESIIYGEAEKIDLFLVKHKILDSPVFEHFKDDLTVADRDSTSELELPQKGIILSGQDWKWYDSYSDVKAWEALLLDAEAFELNYEFVRIGEEEDDVERRQSENCDWVLHVSTSVENFF